MSRKLLLKKSEYNNKAFAHFSQGTLIIDNVLNNRLVQKRQRRGRTKKNNHKTTVYLCQCMYVVKLCKHSLKVMISMHYNNE